MLSHLHLPTILSDCYTLLLMCVAIVCIVWHGVLKKRLKYKFTIHKSPTHWKDNPLKKRIIWSYKWGNNTIPRVMLLESEILYETIYKMLGMQLLNVIHSHVLCKLPKHLNAEFKYHKNIESWHVRFLACFNKFTSTVVTLSAYIHL